VIKPQLREMTLARFKEYLDDVQTQARHRASAISRRAHPVKLEAEVAAPVKHILTRSAVVLQIVGAETDNEPRKKPRVKAHISKEQYLTE
jgi:hypothetical protein